MTASANSGGAGGAGGSANSGGAGGSGGSAEVTTSASTTASTAGGGTGGEGGERDVRVSKVDILFVVDNSISMADKQPYLAQAAGELVNRLADPGCVDGEDAALAEGCPEGQHREFLPIQDMHIGVISSSLGSQGGDICSPSSASWVPSKNDAGKLMPSVRDELDSYQDRGFLAWDGYGNDADAAHDLGTLKTAVAEHIVSAGDVGCGYEMPLEAMYRFLIDPSPPAEIVVIDDLAQPATDEAGNVLVDTELLDQRADFLRPDSALVVVLLSDEDDCSIQGTGLGWITSTSQFNGTSFTMPRETSACEVDPNDPCCHSCGMTAPVDGCVPEDPNCSEGREVETDALNLRCFEQKRRFGFDLLYPVDRYVAGLTDTQIFDTWACSDEECPGVRNPLFPPQSPDGTFTRRASEVFVVSLGGVPWQDLATEESLTGEGLTYKSSYNAGDWSLMLGDPSNYVAPEDPFMRASIDPRSGTHPITDEPIVPPDSSNPLANSINGHEIFNTDNAELQYACIFPLTSPKDCSTFDGACACLETDLAKNRPLCQEPNGSEATTTQYFAAATPGLRQLELMSKLPHAVPASICPKVVEGDVDASAYGYNPAVRALVRELGSVLK